jgi:branched-chain amino acid transport system substrate-binding protein
MAKIISFLAICLMLLGLIAGCGTSSPKPIKIGAIYNLEGSQASLDTPSAEGAKLALKELNKNGGVLGRKLDLVLYDGKSDSATINKAATQLIEKDKVSLIIGFSDTDMVLAVASIAASSKVVFITSGATSPMLPQQVKDYLFLACFGDNVQAAAGAEYAFNTLNLKTAALLFDSQMEYTVLLQKYFTESYEELGGQVVLQDTYEGGTKDYSIQIDHIKALNKMPDLLYIAAGPDDIGTIVKQFRELDLNVPIFGGDAYDTPRLAEIAGKYANDVYFTTHVFLDENSSIEVVKQFVSAYKKEYGKLPENSFAALGYDTLMLAADAIQRAGSEDANSIIIALLNINNLQLVTGSISFKNGSRIPQKSVSVVSVKEGRVALEAVVMPLEVPSP